MYYETLKNLIEDEFKISGFGQDIIFESLDILNILSEHSDKLSPAKEIITVSAIAFIVLEKKGDFKNFREIANIFGTDAKKIALKAKEIALILSIENFEELMTRGLSIVMPSEKLEVKQSVNSFSSERKVSLENTSVTTSKRVTKKDLLLESKDFKNNTREINDEELLILFKSFMKFAYQLFKNKEFIEIKLFLKIFENNLNLAGFDTKKINIEEKFGNLFYVLGFEPKKGREPEKFVKLKDRFGQSEPYSLIRLGE